MKKQMNTSRLWLVFATLVWSIFLSFRPLVAKADEPITLPPGKVYVHIREIGYTDDGKYLEDLGYGT